jgi:hypothetical protein
MLALTVLIAQRAHATEPPAGHLLIAKSSRDFGGTQGENGWRYLFDRGDGTPTTPMPYFLPSWQWCVTPNYGGYTQSPEFSHKKKKIKKTIIIKVKAILQNMTLKIVIIKDFNLIYHPAIQMNLKI